MRLRTALSLAPRDGELAAPTSSSSAWAWGSCGQARRHLLGRHEASARPGARARPRALSSSSTSHDRARRQSRTALGPRWPQARVEGVTVIFDDEYRRRPTPSPTRGSSTMAVSSLRAPRTSEGGDRPADRRGRPCGSGRRRDRGPDPRRFGEQRPGDRTRPVRSCPATTCSPTSYAPSSGGIRIERLDSTGPRSTTSSWPRPAGRSRAPATARVRRRRSPSPCRRDPTAGVGFAARCPSRSLCPAFGRPDAPPAGEHHPGARLPARSPRREHGWATLPRASRAFRLTLTSTSRLPSRSCRGRSSRS